MPDVKRETSSGGSASDPFAFSFEGDSQTPSDADDLDAIRAENTRLKQRAAQLEADQAKGLPFIRAAQKLYKRDKALFERLMTDEELTPKDEKKVEKEADKVGLTVDELRAVMQEEREKTVEAVEQRMYAGFNARESRQNIEAWAAENIPHYAKLKGSEFWKRKLIAIAEEVQEGVESGIYTIPDEFEGSVVKWSMAQAYDLIEKRNPEIAKERRTTTAKGEETKAAKKAATKVSGSATSDDEELPEDVREEILAIRNIGRGATVGESYSNRRSRSA